MHTITLTATELMLCAHRAGLIRGVKQVQHEGGRLANRRVAHMDDFELHYLGMLGEAAVARLLGVQVREDITTFGDGMIDMELSGQSIQVKTSSHATLKRKRLVFFNSKDEFKADWMVQCSLQGAASIGVHGFISREKFGSKAFTSDFGYGERVCVDEAVLAPIDVMKQALSARAVT